MKFTVEPGTGTCTANVLNDPADPKSPKSRCCKVPAVWRVTPHRPLGYGPVYNPSDPFPNACPKHLNIVLTDLNEGWSTP